MPLNKKSLALLAIAGFASTLEAKNLKADRFMKPCEEEEEAGGDLDLIVSL